MNWQLVWLVVAEHDLLWMPWRLAAKVDAAVLEFAATGRGYERTSVSDPRQGRIRVPGA